MTTKKNAARVAVKAAALPKGAPLDVFDCLAAGIPEDQWEAALDHDQARAWNAWLAQGCVAAPATEPQATPAALLPTVQQLMYLACAIVTSSLSEATRKARLGSAWRDEYECPLDVVALALQAVESLTATLSETCDLDEFAWYWWQASSAVCLARDAFPNKEAPAWFHLSAAAHEFKVFGDALDFLNAQQEPEGGEA